MGKLVDLKGEKFNRLTVLSIAPRKKSHTMWLCECECGNLSIVDSYALRKGTIKSCGCLRKEKAKTIGENVVHGMSETRLYHIWEGMKQRCSNPKAKSYEWYGGKGISIYEAWNDFEVFYEWAIKNGYCDNLSIDRIDNEKDYEPTNCRWVTIREQAFNKKTNRYITFNGIKKTITEWSMEFNISSPRITQRLNSGWSVESALTTPVRR